MAINKLKSLTKMLIVFTSLFTMSSCFPDGGLFEDDEDYYNTFGDITLLSKDFSPSSYSMKDDFYNEEIQEELKAAMDEDYYSYIFVEAGRDVTIDEMYLYVIGESSVTLNVDLVVVDSIPIGMKPYDVEDDEEETDESSNEETSPVESTPEEVESNTDHDSSSKAKDEDPTSSGEEESLGNHPEAIATNTVRVGKEWSDFTFDMPIISLDEGDYLGVRFINNTFLGKKQDFEPVKIAMTALLIHACEEDGGDN